MRPIWLLTILIALVAALAPATAEDTAAIRVDHTWARATPGGATTGAVYLEIEAGPGITDTLTGAATAAAGRVDIHTHTMDGDVMRMRQIDGVTLKAGGRVVLAPHGDHLMLLDLKAPLKEGDHLRLKLTFAASPPIEVDAPVLAIGAAGP